MKLKMKYIKVKNGKGKLNEKIENIKQKNTYILFSIYTCKANIVEAEEVQSNLLKNIVEFNNKSRPRPKKRKNKKDILMKLHMFLTRVEN